MRDLRQGEASARDEGRLFGDRGGRGGHYDHRHLRLRRNRRGSERERRQTKSSEKRNLVVQHELLRDPPRRVGDATVILDDQLDFLPGDRRAVLLYVELDRSLDLPAG